MIKCKCPKCSLPRFVCDRDAKANTTPQAKTLCFKGKKWPWQWVIDCPGSVFCLAHSSGVAATFLLRNVTRLCKPAAA